MDILFVGLKKEFSLGQNWQCVLPNLFPEFTFHSVTYLCRHLKVVRFLLKEHLQFAKPVGTVIATFDFCSTNIRYQ